jgi:hypothetical protein
VLKRPTASFLPLAARSLDVHGSSAAFSPGYCCRHATRSVEARILSIALLSTLEIDYGRSFCLTAALAPAQQLAYVPFAWTDGRPVSATNLGAGSGSTTWGLYDFPGDTTPGPGE